MKTMTKMMVVAIALLLATALLVAPAAARGTDIRDIQNGDTIFVWETGLNLSLLNSTNASGTAFVGATLKSLRKYSEDNPTKALLHEIPITNPGNFEVLSPDVDGNYGVYYGWNGTHTTTAGTATNYKSVNIRSPTLTLDALLNTTQDSIDGDSVAKNTHIEFRIDAPFVGAFYKNGTTYPGKVKVEVTTPAGGKTTNLNGVVLEGIEVNKTQFRTASIVLNLDAGTYTAVVKWESYDYNRWNDYAPTSNTASFTVVSKTTEITSNVDTIVRNNNFVVTINGESNTNYYVYVQSAPASDKTPYVRPNQPGVTVSNAELAALAGLTPANYNNISGASAKVKTNAAGTRTVEFVTNKTTEEKTYTLRVILASDKTDYDTVKVKVEKGAITITASGDRTYYIGEEITFSGTNTDSDKVYLFVTGPNLESKDGVKADDPTVKTVSDASAGFKEVDVKSDDTWEWKFDTQGYAVDAGTYTYYAVTDMKNRAALSDAEYATISVVLRKGFVSSSASATTVAKGDKLFIRGNAQGNPNDVAIWIIGTNHLVRATESVNDDSSFEYELKSEATKDLAAGQYFVIVQHPMGDGVFNVDLGAKLTPADTDRIGIVGTDGKGTDGFIYKGTGRLQGSDAAQALIDLLNNQNVDDTYNKLTFLVQEPWINIDSISDKYIGTTFTISGTTNLGVDNELLVDVKSSAFQPTDKTASGEFSGDAGTVKVVAGDAGYNTWSFEVNAAAFKADEYIVKVESIEADTTATATFNVLEGVPVTQPPATQPPATQPPATTPPTDVPATPASPGFGALVAIAGLGAVAFLVLRRD